ARAKIIAQAICQYGPQPAAKCPDPAVLEAMHLAENHQQNILAQVVAVRLRDARPRYPDPEERLIQVQQPPPAGIAGPRSKPLQQADGGFHDEALWVHNPGSDTARTAPPRFASPVQIFVVFAIGQSGSHRTRTGRLASR